MRCSAIAAREYSTWATVTAWPPPPASCARSTGRSAASAARAAWPAPRPPGARRDTNSEGARPRTGPGPDSLPDDLDRAPERVRVARAHAHDDAHPVGPEQVVRALERAAVLRPGRARDRHQR